MTRPLTLILTAVQMETRAMVLAWEKALVPTASIQQLTIGIGAVRIPTRVPDDCLRVILAGMAGALDPALAVGDVVLDETDLGASDGMGMITYPCHASIIRGRIKTVRTPLLTAAEKAALFAESGAIAVDMEGDIVRQWAAAAGVPFVHLRAISDAAGDSLDPAVFGLVDEVGRPRTARVAAYALRHPTRLAALARLGSAAKLACANVAADVVRLLSD